MYRKRNEIREKIVDSAKKIFHEKGYSASINEICREAGITRSSFYNQFTSKDAILFYIMESANMPSEDAFDAIMDAPNDFERIWIMVENRLKVLEELGPEIVGAIIPLELNSSFGLIHLPDHIKDRNAKLYRKCMESGIAETLPDPEEMLQLSELSIHALIFEWARLKGSFDLRAECRRFAELTLQIREPYRTSRPTEVDFTR